MSNTTSEDMSSISYFSGSTQLPRITSHLRSSGLSVRALKKSAKDLFPTIAKSTLWSWVRQSAIESSLF